MIKMIPANVVRLLSDFSTCTNNPESFISVQDDVSQKLQLATKQLYDCIKSCEDATKGDALPELIVAGFDDEQVWQQIELQNEPSLKSLIGRVSKSNVSKQKTFTSLPADDDDSVVSSEHEAEEELSEDADIDEIEEDTSSRPRGDEELALFGDDDAEDSEDEEMMKVLDRAIAENKKTDGSDDEGSFSELALPDEDADVDDGKDDFLEDRTTSMAGSADRWAKSGQRSEVDDHFFKLSAMEAFLDQEDAQEERRRNQEKQGGQEEDDEEEDNDEYVDMFSVKGLEDNQGKHAKDICYADFFDPPLDDDSSANKTKKVTFKTDKAMGNTARLITAGQGDDDDLSSESEGEDAADILGHAKKTKKANEKSSFEKRQEKLGREINKLEASSLEAKSWQLSGEIGSASRPENSLLQEDLRFEHTTRPAVSITEEITKSLEQCIIQRIKDKAWDDVVRKVRKKEEPYEYKKRVVLNQEKSKLSLGEVYEQEYLKQTQDVDEDEAEEKVDAEHEEIRKMMSALFVKLDALSNFHYTPKPATTELKVISKLPSLVSEEVAPVSVSDAALLAPEEIAEKRKGEMTGDTEKTTTDKKRERRSKKQRQHFKREAREAREKAKGEMAVTSKAGKRKALKALEVESRGNKHLSIITDKGTNSGLTSSKRVFTQLQEDKTVKSSGQAKKKRKTETPKTKTAAAANFKL